MQEPSILPTESDAVNQSSRSRERRTRQNRMSREVKEGGSDPRESIDEIMMQMQEKPKPQPHPERVFTYQREDEQRLKQW